MIAKNDEVKRSKIWRIVTAVSTVVIIVGVVLLLTKLFTTNPLEGEWADEDGSFNMSILKNGSMVITIPEEGADLSVDVDMKYTLNKDEKTITITPDEAGFQKLADKTGGQYTEEEIRQALSTVITTFDYSVDQEQLTLTEREYGEQLVLIKE
ncbi:MAG: hypothetical protein HFG82_10000 [Dorea sp.]|jgi:hypothetical protein|nr:hypothetical protein [Dorea sp.]GFI42763.1 hypothetical protein IMSAGC018_00426 [Lachnospiraceae bacterium]